MIGRVLSAITGNLWQMGCIALLALLAWQTLRIEGYKDKVDHITTVANNWKQAFELEKSALIQTKQNYINAEAVATAQNRQHVAEAVAVQERISRNAASNYQSRIAALVDYNSRLRNGAKSGSAPAGDTGATGAPAVSNTAGGTHAAPCLLSDDERLIANKQAIQLDELITWVEQQKAGSDRLNGN